MTNIDYAEMADEIRAVLPQIRHRQAAADLHLLADRYERLAHYLEAAPDELSDMPLEFRRQAG